MLRHGLHRWLIMSLRSLRPQVGAVANAREALRDTARAGAERRDAAVSQSRSSSPEAWTLAQAPGPSSAPPHAARLYRDDAELGSWLASYIADGLVRGEHCLVIATGTHRTALRQRLALAGLSQQAEQLLVDHDADEVLQSFMRGGQPDRALFRCALPALLPPTGGSTGRVRAFGEMVGLLHAQGQLDAALQLEVLWTELQGELGFPLLCAYPVLPGSHDTDHGERIQAHHSHLAAVGA